VKYFYIYGRRRKIMDHSDEKRSLKEQKKNKRLLEKRNNSGTTTRSKSLDNICDNQLDVASPSKSLISSSPKFKVLRKKLHLLKLSKSNTDIAIASQIDHAYDIQPKLQTSSSGSMLIEGRNNFTGTAPKDILQKSVLKDELRKKSRNEMNSGSNSLYDQFSMNNKLTDKLDLSSSLISRQQRRSSSDSFENYVNIDSPPYDSYYEDGSSAYEMYDDTDGAAPAEHTALEAERLMKKIEKIRDELKRMQATKDECVQEYLNSVENSDGISANEKIKVNFEKHNQKTNNTIQLLQKKLEKHQLQLKALDERGIHGTRKIMRVVQDSMRSGKSTLTGAVSKPLESINQFIKKDKKTMSSENIAITVTRQGDDEIERNYLNSIGRSYSDDEMNSSSSSNHIAVTNGSTDEKLSSSHDVYDVGAPEYPTIHHDKINDIAIKNDMLLHTVDELKDTIAQLVQSLQDERYKTEQVQTQLDELLNQWNDLTELHQNEMMDLKQEMDRAGERIECVEYRFTERTDEIEESVDARITRMELQQQQQQQMLLSVDNYFDGSGNAKVLLSKFLSLVISLFAIVLVIMTTVAKIVMPFATTRMRVVTTVATLTALILLWRNSEHEVIKTLVHSVQQLFRPVFSNVVIQEDKER